MKLEFGGGILKEEKTMKLTLEGRTNIRRGKHGAYIRWGKLWSLH